MTLKGHVDNGVIVLDDPVKLPHGTQVTVKPTLRKRHDATGIAGSWVDERSAEEIVFDIKPNRRSGA